MEDPRTQKVVELGVALITSANPLYATRSLQEVTAEILGSADGIDHVFGICKCGGSDDEEDGGGGGPEAPRPGDPPKKAIH